MQEYEQKKIFFAVKSQKSKVKSEKKYILGHKSAYARARERTHIIIFARRRAK